MRTHVMLAALVAGALVLAGSAAASHLPRQTLRCTYEVGQLDFLQLSDEDHAGVTNDGGINLGGCNHRLPRHPDILSFSVPFPADPDVLQISLLDDTFGTSVGATFCNDFNNDHTCAEDNPGETNTQFCSSSPIFIPEDDSDGDGRNDFGHHLFVLMNGPVAESLFCNPGQNPVGATTGGVLNPNGGVFYTFT